MSDLSSVKGETALHRAFQLQPECVLREPAILLDLDCANLNMGRSSRLDGIALFQNGGLVLAEFKLEVTGRGKTSADKLIEPMKHRVIYASRHIGEQSVRHLRWLYEMRFLNEKASIREVRATIDQKRLPTYVIAAGSFRPLSCVDSIIEVASTSCKDLPLFNLRFVHMKGEVMDTGRILLADGEVVREVQLGIKQESSCQDDAEIKHQHEWVPIPRVQQFENVLREFMPDVRLRSKRSHVNHSMKIGMLHPWGIGLGDVGFSIDLKESNPHCYLQCCKREDIGQNLQPIVDDFQEEVASDTGVGKDDVIPYQGNGCYIFETRFSAEMLKTNEREIARRFANYVQSVIPIVTDYIW